MQDHEREERARRQSESAIAPGADPVEPRDPSAEAVPRRRSTALLFAIPAIIIVLIGLGWMLLAERDRSEETAPGGVQGTTGEEGPESGLNPGMQPAATGGITTTPPPASDDQLLANPDQFTGRTANLEAVPVLRTHGQRSFRAGRPGASTLVLLDESIKTPGPITPGRHVDLTGRIERVPSGDVLLELNLEADDRAAVEGEDVYFHATSVTPHGEVPTGQ